MSIPVISRLDAKAAGALRYFTGTPCRNGHISEKQVSNWTCLRCACDATNARNAKDPTKNRARVSLWHKENPERSYAQSRGWKLSNLDKVRADGRAYAKANPEIYARNCALRYATKLRATPAWADLKKIAAVYTECRKANEETGIEHEVDHIIPLRGKTVCGLHVHYNLQVITGEANRRKLNKLLAI